MRSPHKAVASLSLDLDDKWTYMKTRGLPGWQSFPSYLETAVPRILRFLEERSLRITFFIVGQDAALPRNAALIRSIAEAGHEVANHSFRHEPWLHLYSKAEIEQELELTEQHIQKLIGRNPRGFRGPGYSMSGAVAEVLAARGYQYDASLLPTFLGPMARAYYLLTSQLGADERDRRSQLFGHWRDGLRPLQPFQWVVPSGSFVEIPVTTMPVFRTPFHLSYLIWLSGYSDFLARQYLRLSLGLCAACKVRPSFLLHPLDFLTLDEAPELGFFPGMAVPLERKLSMADFVIARLARRHRIVTMGEHSIAADRSLAARPDIPIPPATIDMTPARQRVAYVMPVFQAQSDFDDTMDSLAASTIPCAVLVVDDGSQPALQVRDYGPQLQVTLIRLPHNQGIVAALNAGLQAALAANYEFIARIDAGDFASPDRLAQQTKYLDAHPQCMLVGSDADIRDENGSYRFTIKPPRDPKTLAEALHERAWLLHPSVMYRASVLRQVGLYSDLYKAAEDYEMFHRIAVRHEVGVVPEPLLTYVLRKSGISGKNVRVQAVSRLRIQLHYFQWNRWLSYYGALRTIGTLLIPHGLKQALKSKLVYSRMPSQRVNDGRNLQIR